MRYITVPLIATILYFVSDQTKILMLDMIIASLKSDMAYLTQAIKQMDDKAKKSGGVITGCWAKQTIHTWECTTLYWSILSNTSNQ